jgi:hypothetical protein
MHRSRLHSASRSTRWLLPFTLFLLAVPLGAIRAQDTTGMSQDQLFLRHQLQGHVGVSLIVHATQHMPGTFPAKTDAQKVDQRLDDEMDRLRTALKSIYNDAYAPQPRATAVSLGDSLAKLTGAAYDATFRKWIIEYDRLLILGIDNTMPKLTNATVKALAQKMRASASAEMTALKAEASAPIPS